MQDLIIQIIEKIGYLGVFLLITLENVFPPIPSEVILTFGGFMTTKSNLDILGVIISATAGSVAGALILYGIGRVLGVNRIQKLVRSFGRVLRIRTGDVASAVRFYDRHKKGTVFFCRLIPILRSLISVPAGMARMNLAAFILLTALGSLIWNCVLTLAGAALGSSWHLVLGYMDYFSLAVCIGLGAAAIVYLGFHIAKRMPKHPKILCMAGATAHGLSRIQSRMAEITGCSCGAANIDGILEEFIIAETGKRRRLTPAFRKMLQEHGQAGTLLRLEGFLSAYEALIRRHKRIAYSAAYLPEIYCRALCVAVTGLKNGNIGEILDQTISCYYKIWLSGAIDDPAGYLPALTAALKSGDTSLYLSELKRVSARYADDRRIKANISGDISKMDFGKALLLLSLYEKGDCVFIPDDGKTRYSPHKNKKTKNFYTLNLIRSDAILLPEHASENGRKTRAEAVTRLTGISPAHVSPVSAQNASAQRQ